jgi:hypothetical protein
VDPEKDWDHKPKQIKNNMKKTILTIGLVIASLSASAVTFWSNGVLMGTVCRNGIYYTVYPTYMAQAVGTVCPMRDPYGAIVGYGYVTAE